MSLNKKRYVIERHPLKDKTNNFSEDNSMSKESNKTRRLSMRQNRGKLRKSTCDCHKPNLTNRSESLQDKVNNKKVTSISTVNNQTKLSKKNTKINETKTLPKTNSSQEKQTFNNIENSNYPIVILTRRLPDRELSPGQLKENDKCKSTIKKSVISKKATKTQKKVLVQCDSSDTSLNSNQRVLRKRKTKNYADSIRESSINENENNNNNNKSHVPIYLKAATDKIENKPKDPFEFTYESPTKHVKKKKIKVVTQKRLPLGSKRGTKLLKNIINDSDSDFSFHVISKAVKKKSNKEVKAINKTEIEQTHLKEPCKRAEPSKHVPVIELNTGGNEQNVNFCTEEVLKKIMDWSLVESNRKCVETDSISEDDHYFGFDDGDDWRDDDLSHILQSTSGVTTTINAANTREHTKCKFSLSTSTPQNLRVNLPKSSRNKKITIISNTILSPSRANITANHNAPKTPSEVNKTSDFRGFDNDTLSLNNKLRTSETNSPWRSDDLNVRRNPHFLSMKNTSLPCYNQDMILDPKLLELPKSAKILGPETIEKNLRQTDILDYFNDRSNVESSNKEDASLSLFDLDDFSPIKSKKKLSEANVSKVSNLKRELNFGNEISPLKAVENLPSISKSINVDQGIEDFFGFNDSDDKENRKSKSRLKLKKKSEEGPMRVPVEEIKRAKEVVQKKCLEIFVEKEKELEKTIENVASAEVIEDEAPCVGLFEELQELSTRKYVRKRPRRVRIASVEVEEEPVENEKHKKKRRDGLSKAEEAELNKWAAQFNAMCDEIEKHELETV